MKKRMIAMYVCLIMLISGIAPAGMETTAHAGETKETSWSPNPPETTNENENGRTVSWDSVWFGSYPQSEVKSTDPVYSALEAETGWDENGDAVVDGDKYRRIKQSDATYVYPENKIAYYQWADADTYHYFKYEPIRWRVLNIDSDTTGNILLLSDIVLDNQFYHADTTEGCESVTWETSTIRSWLNGYGSTVNDLGISYESKNFINTAFSSDEKAAISDTNVVNNDNLTSGTAGGNPTTDKVFLLSEEEVYRGSAMSHGFAVSSIVCDEARICGASTYAWAMGVFFMKHRQASLWWLRSPGSIEFSAAYVDNDGMVNRDGKTVDYYSTGVRAALNLNLSSLNKVCTKADVVQVESTEPGNMFRIDYYTNGVENDPASQKKEYGVPLTLTTEKPTRLGYTFLGWSEDSKATSPSYEAGGEYTEEKDAELYAVWKATVPGDTLTVTYNANGGSEAPGSQVKQKGVALTLSAQKPVRAGYTFLGWSADRKATAPSYNVGGEYTIDQDITLYAVWGKTNTANVKMPQTITTSAYSYTKAYGSKAFALGARTNGGGKLTYSSSNKKVAAVTSGGKVSVKKYGTAKITIKAAATQSFLSASKTVIVKVVPQKVTLKSVKSPSSRTMVISWKKNKDATGYEIMASPKKKFNRKTLSREYKKVTSRSISGWKSKTKYYVRVRAYKKIGKTKYYGAWSNVRSARVK